MQKNSSGKNTINLFTLASIFFILINGCSPAKVKEVEISIKDTSSERINDSYKYSSQYVSLYPPAEQIFYAKLERINNPEEKLSGINIYLSNTLSGFEYYLYEVNDGKETKTVTGIVPVLFNTEAKTTQQSVVTVRARYNGKATRNYSMKISYDTKQVYSEAGKNSYSHDLIILNETDLYLVDKRVSDYVTSHPTSEEKKYARNEFMKNIHSGKDGYEQAQNLAAYIVKQLAPYQGIPSDAMDNLTPFQQYQRVMSGKDEVWCGNNADIFAYVCTCLDIPVRRIGLGFNYDMTADPNIMTAEGHTTTEVYDQKNKEWRLIDLTFNMLGVFLKGNEAQPLNMLEFYYALNNPAMVNKLIVREYDVQSGSVKNIPVTESVNYKKYQNFYKLNQRFSYAAKDGFITLW